MSEVTRILQSMEQGTAGAADELLSLVYGELRSLAASKMSKERPGQTLQATALVHEAWLRLFPGNGPSHFENRAHFFGAAAEAMRRILIDRANSRKRRLGGSNQSRVEFDEAAEAAVSVTAPDDELLAVHEVIDQLATKSPDEALMLKLRYFMGMTMPDAAKALGIPLRTAELHWTFAKAWLRSRLRK